MRSVDLHGFVLGACESLPLNKSFTPSVPAATESKLEILRLPAPLGRDRL